MKKMKKNIIIISSIIILLLTITVIIINSSNLNINNIINISYLNKNKVNTNSWITNNINWIEQIEKWEENREISKEEVDDKIDLIRKKLSLKWLIEKWDYFFEKEEYTISLTKFLKILNEIPKDEETIKKIWDIYYQLKQFDKSYNYYSKIKNYSKLSKQKAINSLIFSYTNNFDLENIWYIKKELNTFNLNNKELFYYTNSLDCIVDFNLCESNFENYFNEYENNTQTWTNIDLTEKTNEITKNLENIENAFINYKNFKIDDLSYKNALISGSFFSNWLYPIAIETAKKILINKNDYKPIIKIIAKSYYELGLFSESKDFLIKYNDIDNSDEEINYFLWVIHQKLREYVLSSIFLKKSIDLWYSNSIEARRRIIFNYSQVWETEKMLSSFTKLIEDEYENITLEDLNLAIYFHINNDKIFEAEKLINLWIKKFWEQVIFYWYKWWINIEQNWKIEWALELAEKNLFSWYEIDKYNPMINYIIWILYIKKNDYINWTKYLKETLVLDEKWEFWKRANNILQSLNF